MKVLKIAILLVILVSFVLLLAHKIELPSGDDMARHIENGKQILQGNFDVIYSNFYSYTEGSYKFINHHWLSGVVFYFLFNLVGWTGLSVFKILVSVVTFAILFAVAKKKSNFWLAAVFSLPTLFVIGGRTLLRPEVFSYLFIAIFIWILFESERKPNSNKIFWLLPLQLLWVNMHIFFFIGIALAAGFLAERIFVGWGNLKHDPLVKKLIILILGLILVCFANPNGIAGALYPLKIFNNYGVELVENDPISKFLRLYPAIENINIFAFFVSIAILAVGFVLNRKNKPIFFFLATLTTAVLSFKIIRGLSLFALVFLPAASISFYPVFLKARNWIESKPKEIQNIKYILASLLLIMALGTGYFAVSQKYGPYFEFGLGLTEASNNAAQFIKENEIKGPIFNDHDIGSYLIFNLYPQEKVFVDNRAEAYPESFFNDVYNPILTNENKWQEELDKYNFNSIVFYRYDEGDGAIQFLYNRVSDPKWVLVFADQYAAVFVRNSDENREVIEKFKITADNAGERFEPFVNSGNYWQMIAASDNFDLVGRRDLAMKTLFEITNRWPDRGRIWMVMGEKRYFDGDQNPQSNLLAISYFDRAIAEGYKNAEVYSFLGAAYYKVGYKEIARGYLEKSLKMNPLQGDAREILNAINGEGK